MEQLKFKGTKGEWEVDLLNETLVLTDKGAYRPNTIMKCSCSDDELEANAKLIAAAPDLLEALQFALENKLIFGRAADKAKVAIEKALK